VIHEGNPGIYTDANGAGIFGTLEFLNNSTTPTPVPGGIRGIVDTISSDTPTAISGETPVDDALPIG
jgi:hypothetical protein